MSEKPKEPYSWRKTMRFDYIRDADGNYYYTWADKFKRVVSPDILALLEQHYRSDAAKRKSEQPNKLNVW